MDLANFQYEDFSATHQWKKTYSKFLRIQDLPESSVAEKTTKESKLNKFLIENFEEFDEINSKMNEIYKELNGPFLDKILEEVFQKFNDDVENKIEKTYLEKYGAKNIRTVEDREKFMEEKIRETQEEKMVFTKVCSKIEENQRHDQIKKIMMEKFTSAFWSADMFGFGKRAVVGGLTDEDGFVL